MKDMGAGFSSPPMNLPGGPSWHLSATPRNLQCISVENRSTLFLQAERERERERQTANRNILGLWGWK